MLATTQQRVLLLVAILLFAAGIFIYVVGRPHARPLSQTQLQADIAHMHATAGQPATPAGGAHAGPFGQ